MARSCTPSDVVEAAPVAVALEPVCGAAGSVLVVADGAGAGAEAGTLLVLEVGQESPPLPRRRPPLPVLLPPPLLDTVCHSPASACAADLDAVLLLALPLLLARRWQCVAHQAR
jgi:hypothetical protein